MKAGPMNALIQYLEVQAEEARKRYEAQSLHGNIITQSAQFKQLREWREALRLARKAEQEEQE